MSQTSPEQLPLPIEQHPERVVEAIYAAPQEDGLAPYVDTVSRDGFEDYLAERMAPRWTRFIPGGWEQIEEAVPVRRPEFRGWERPTWNLRRAAGVFLGVNIAANTILPLARDPNGSRETNVEALIEDIIEEGQQLKDGIQDWLHWDGEKVTLGIDVGTKEVTTKEPNPDYRGEWGTGGPEVSKVGETDPNPEVVDRLLDQMEKAINEGFNLQQVSLFGSSSDELRDPASIGRADQANAEYAAERANKLADALRAGMAERGITEPEIVIKAEESILSPANVAKLNDTVAQFGYENASSLIAAYNRDPQSVPPSVKAFLDVEIGSKRGVVVGLAFKDSRPETIEVVTTVPTVEFTRDVDVIEDDGEPRDDNHDYGLIVLPAVWPPRVHMPEVGMTEKVKIKKRWVKNPDKGVPHNVWVELYPEALDENNELSRDAWAMTRKYQVLMRENRVNGVYQFGYKDADGKDQTLRVMFVDHDPNADTLEFVAGLMQDVSQMRGGKVAERLGMVAIFPSDNVGKHGDAKRIGLGVDQQEGASVLGIAMPSLGLVEVQMPPTSSREETDSFTGARWTLAHEIAGHFTDVKHRPTQLVPAGGQDYVARNPWEDAGSRSFLPAVRRGLSLRRWITTRKVVDRNGDEQTITSQVDGGDSSLQESVRIQKLGMPTRYAATHQAEMFAETAAQVTTDILIPGNEFGQVMGAQKPGEFAEGFEVDPQLRDMFIDHVAVNPERPNDPWVISIKARDNWTHTYEPVRKDQAVSNPELAGIFRHARIRPLPRRRDLVRILTQMTNSELRQED